MNALEIIILVGAAALVVFTVVFNIIRKRKGKTSCGCDGCRGCPSAGKCGTGKAETKSKTDKE